MSLPSGIALADLTTWQRELAMRLERGGSGPRRPRYVGCDVSVRAERTVAVAVLWDLEGGVGPAVAVEAPTCFPYVPGFLSFREVPALRLAVDHLTELVGDRRDWLLVVDGHGRIHPREVGIAAHLGLVVDLPSLGVAKQPFVGRGLPPEREAGAMAPVFVAGELRGWCWRSRTAVRPIYVSPGHQLSVAAVRGHLPAIAGGRRLPEPIRWADNLSRLVRRGAPLPGIRLEVRREPRLTWRLALP